MLIDHCAQLLFDDFLIKFMLFFLSLYLFTVDQLSVVTDIYNYLLFWLNYHASLVNTNNLALTDYRFFTLDLNAFSLDLKKLRLRIHGETIKGFC
jgi:hypothetical protein